MSGKKKVAVTVCAISFIVAAGVIETIPLVAFLLLAVMGAAIFAGKLYERM